MEQRRNARHRLTILTFLCLQPTTGRGSQDKLHLIRDKKLFPFAHKTRIESCRLPILGVTSRSSPDDFVISLFACRLQCDNQLSEISQSSSARCTSNSNTVRERFCAFAKTRPSAYAKRKSQQRSENTKIFQLMQTKSGFLNLYISASFNVI